MKKYAMTAGLLAALLSSPALAQDAGEFAGPRLEVLGGYDNVEGDDGFAYAIAGGYDLQTGRTVLGLEVEAGDSTTGESETDVDVAGDRLSIDATRDLYVGARIGVVVAPNTLLYAKGGYANGRTTLTYDGGTTVTKDAANAEGYRIGAGVERKLGLFGSNGYAKLEYRYTNYGNINDAGANFDVDADRHQVLAGIGIRF